MGFLFRHARKQAVAYKVLGAAWFFFFLAGSSLEAGDVSLRWRWSNPLPHGGNVFDMSSAFGIAVQVAERGQVYTSDDLVTWIPRESGTTNSLRSVTFFGTRLVISGESGTIVYADSLDDLHVVDLGTGDWLEGIAASPSLLVAVGDNAAIYTSTNAANWSRANPAFNGWLRSVAYSPDLDAFVAVGEQGLLATSDNGRSWTTRNSGTSRHLNRVAWVSGRFWVLGEGGVVLNNSAGSVTKWTALNAPGTNTLSAFASESSSSALVAGDHAVHRRQGNTWQDETDPAKAFPAPKWTYYSALWTGDIYFVAGRSGMMVEGFQTNASSPWIWVNREESVRNWLWDIWRAPEFYVTVGDRATIMTSSDGVDWDLELPPLSATNSVLLGVAGSSNLLVAVGSQGTILLSPSALTTLVSTNSSGQVITNTVDTMGVLWHAISPPVTNDLQGIASLGDTWVVSGSGGAILTGQNGSNWVKRATPTTAHLSSVASFTGGFVAVGKGGTLLTSPTGESWTQRPVNTTNWLYRVRYVNGSFVVLGENGTILTSPDGATWTPRSSGTIRWLTDVAFVGGKYFACGHLGALLVSSDLARWEYTGTATEKALFGLAHDGQRLLVAGVEGSILRAEAVPDVEPISFIDYARQGTANIVLVSGNTGQRFRIDRSPDLLSWEAGSVYEFLDSTGTLLLIEDSGTNVVGREFYRGVLVP